MALPGVKWVYFAGDEKSVPPVKDCLMLDFPNSLRSGVKVRAAALLTGLVGVNALVWLLTWGAAHRVPSLAAAGCWPTASACGTPWTPTTSRPLTTPPGA